MKWLTLLCMGLSLQACFTTTLSAPEKQQVKIMAQDAKPAFSTEFKDWYILGGLIPVYRHSIEDLIREERLVEVRVRTEDRISDGIITFLTNYILPVFPQSIVVEGNRAAEPAPTQKAEAPPSQSP